MLELERHRRPGRQPAKARAEHATRRLPLAVALLLALLWAILPTAAQELPDVPQAKRDLAEARAELEEIVGPRLLRLDPPPLPEVPRLELGDAERSLVERLTETPPGAWDAGDRARLAELLAKASPAVAASGSEGEGMATEELLAHAGTLLQASRLLVLRDRLALVEGREERFADGLAGRTETALRLVLQPNLIGPLFANTLYVQLLGDVHAATLRGETSTGTLERLDELLHRWELEAPDPAAVLARETLVSLDEIEEKIDRREVGAEATASAVFFAPWLQAVARLARQCRTEGCRRAAEAVETGGPSEDEPYGVIAAMMIPNVLDSLKKLTGGEELGRVARTALALRLEALEQGSYPPTLEGLAPELGLTPEQEAELAYERLPEGGARLRLTTDRVVTDQVDRKQDRYRRLLTWDLPLL